MKYEIMNGILAVDGRDCCCIYAASNFAVCVAKCAAFEFVPERKSLVNPDDIVAGHVILHCCKRTILL